MSEKLGQVYRSIIICIQRSSTGTLFELIYGWPVRGPMQVLREYRGSSGT